MYQRNEPPRFQKQNFHPQNSCNQLPYQASRNFYCFRCGGCNHIARNCPSKLTAAYTGSSQFRFSKVQRIPQDRTNNQCYAGASSEQIGKDKQRSSSVAYFQPQLGLQKIQSNMTNSMDPQQHGSPDMKPPWVSPVDVEASAEQQQSAASQQCSSVSTQLPMSGTMSFQPQADAPPNRDDKRVKKSLGLPDNHIPSSNPPPVIYDSAIWPHAIEDSRQRRDP